MVAHEFGRQVTKGARITGSILLFRDPAGIVNHSEQPKIAIVRVDTMNGTKLGEGIEKQFFYFPSELPERARIGSTFRAVIGEGPASIQSGTMSSQAQQTAPYLKSMRITGYDRKAVVRSQTLAALDPGSDSEGPVFN